MNKADAKRIAEQVTVAELKQMLINAEKGIVNWEKPSSINELMSKGKSFNILSKCQISDNMNILVKVNMLREFGEWLPNPYSLPKKKHLKPSQINHEEPNKLPDNFYNDIFNF